MYRFGLLSSGLTLMNWKSDGNIQGQMLFCKNRRKYAKISCDVYPGEWRLLYYWRCSAFTYGSNVCVFCFHRFFSIKSTFFRFLFGIESWIYFFHSSGTFMWIAGRGQPGVWSLTPCPPLPLPRRSTCMSSIWRVWGRREGACALTEPSRRTMSASSSSSTSAETLLPGWCPKSSSSHRQPSPFICLCFAIKLSCMIRELIL